MLRALFKRFFSKKPPPPVINEPAPGGFPPESKPPEPGAAAKPWIGVDLDGTLARNLPWMGHERIGAPVPLMMARVRNWLAQGLTVKIFTARAVQPEAIPPIRRWLAEQGLPELEITNAKDFNMIECWDDRAVQVVQNTGRPFLSPSVTGRPRVPILPEEAANQTFYVLPPRLGAEGAPAATPDAARGDAR
ncbi:MAG: hypothetical protein LBD14_04080 [Puniceicoccales bacterium]|nr:hypothetical protein [Puniceicoccales bacterium]